MGRWEPDARGRLEQAALELYGERGFENTTVAEIAERAGLTERTFFRHFADKREVLFWGAGALQELLVRRRRGCSAPVRSADRRRRRRPRGRPARCSRSAANSRAAPEPSSPRTRSCKSAS
jgi:AcrR family transcriptional regulator